MIFSLSAPYDNSNNLKIMKQINNNTYKVSEITVTYRPKFKSSDRPHVSTSQEVHCILFNNWDLDKIELQEQFKILLLNRANRVIGIYEVSSGGMSGTVADPKLIFAIALKAGASSIILCHNHPSGNLKPSQADIHLTNKLKEAGRFLDIEVMDHIILTSEGYYSFADETLL